MAMRTNSNRLAAIASALFITLILFYTTEPRRRSFSCKTFESCLLAGRPHSYNHPIPAEPAVSEDERTLRDGTLHFTRTIGPAGGTDDSGGDPAARILILVLNKDEESWSRDFRSTGRSIYDFLDLLVATDLDLAAVSLGLMTSSADEYAEIKRATATLPFARAEVFYQAPGGGGDRDRDRPPSYSYEQRHDPAVQRQRRGALAALRNYLMLRSLRDEEHVVWIDADVVELSPGIIQAMLAHATPGGSRGGSRRDDVGLITAACHQNDMENYDKNAWAVDRNASAILDAVREGDRDAAVATLDATRAFTDVILASHRHGRENEHGHDDHQQQQQQKQHGTGADGKDNDNDTDGDDDDELLPLDSVGGTILYIRADLIRRGVIFPTFNVVGTTWSQDGWVGVETEGICYVASSLTGGGCFLLGGKHHVRHADLG